MRTPIEKLARQLLDESPDQSMGELADRFDEPPQRIADAWDFLKVMAGQPSTTPPVDWPDGWWESLRQG